MKFPNLFSPIRIKSLDIRNRIVSTGHQTVLVSTGIPNDELAAYHAARAKGGAGLIIIEVGAVHESAFFSTHTIQAYRDACIPGYRKVADAAHEEGAKVFGQLFHPGREVYGLTAEGTRPVAYAPSSVPAERYVLAPKAMSRDMIQEIIESYASAAARMAAGGLDGVEVVASHGYLPAQFLNPIANVRSDDYGGSFENRLRFLLEVSQSVRRRIGDAIPIGLRISGDEQTSLGLQHGDVLTAMEVLDAVKAFDYYNVAAGSSATAGGALHLVPPMRIENGYVAPLSASAKERVDVPVIVAGRINQPQEAERIIADGKADMCGMTRAMICDPKMAAKAKLGAVDDIQACIACNQACIGHMQVDASISCIQHPETGRELVYGDKTAAATSRKVAVIGGGPAGMKAAMVAAARGHKVRLYERDRQLGGQVRLAQLLPGRAEFGGIITNFEREMQLAGVEVRIGASIGKADLRDLDAEVVIVATGARPRASDMETADDAHVVEASSILSGTPNIGMNVVVADRRGDWIGLGIAELLATRGHSVRYRTSGYMPGQGLHSYLRDQWIGRLHSLGVATEAYSRLFGVDGDSAYFAHTATEEAIVVEGVDTVVLSDHYAQAAAFEDVGGLDNEIHWIGDCVSPRTVEEAVYEGLKIGAKI